MSFPSQISKITDNLYLSSFVGASEYNIMKFNIKLVITVCREVPKCIVKSVESIKLEVVDKPTESLIQYFDYLGEKINQIARQTPNGACLVHCVAGISRSTTIVLAYLMKYLKMSLKDAHAHVKSRRPLIRPNLGFWKQLVDYEKMLFGTNSVRIIETRVGLIPDVYENEVKTMIFLKNSQYLQQMPDSANNESGDNKLINSVNTTNNTANSNNSSNINKYTSPTKNMTPNFFSDPSRNGNDASKVIHAKFNAGPSSIRASILSAEMEAENLASKLNKSHYTTTYRSSYQK